MNERIRELALQATTKIYFRLDPHSYKHIDDPNGDLERFEFDKDKFAELIVRECAGIIDSHKQMALPGEHGRNVSGNDLKEHFGVEE